MPARRAVASLVNALAAVAPRFSPADSAEKVRLLDALADRAFGQPAALLRFHETLCFLAAYPDDPRVLGRVDRALQGFESRVRGLTPAAQARLYDSGLAGTALDYPFGRPMTRWLLSRFPDLVEVAWEKFDGGDQLDEAFSLLITPVEEDAFSYGGLGWEGWLRAAKGGRPLSDLRLIVELLELSPLPDGVRDWWFERLGLPIRWRLRGPGASRTLAKVPWDRPYYHRTPLRRSGVEMLREIARPSPVPRRAPRPLAEVLIETARAALATRFRELHTFSHANPGDVLVFDPGRGIRIALIGNLPTYRFPLEGYYAFLALKNGVPVCYGGGCALFDALDFALNIFPSFRQGESAFLTTQIFAAFHRALGTRTAIIDPYQIGNENEEAIRSGAFYFYHRLGYRPRDPEVVRLAEAELTNIARDRSYRSPVPVLRRLARAELYLVLPGGDPEPEKRLRVSQVAAIVSGHIARTFAGDRGAAIRDATGRVARALGMVRWKAWPMDERMAFERMAVVLGLLPDLAQWPAADRRALVRLIRAKGGRDELTYIRLLDRHRRLRSSLESLVRPVEPILDSWERGS